MASREYGPGNYRSPYELVQPFAGGFDIVGKWRETQRVIQDEQWKRDANEQWAEKNQQLEALDRMQDGADAVLEMRVGELFTQGMGGGQGGQAAEGDQAGQGGQSGQAMEPEVMLRTLHKFSGEYNTMVRQRIAAKERVLNEWLAKNPQNPYVKQIYEQQSERIAAELEQRQQRVDHAQEQMFDLARTMATMEQSRAAKAGAELEGERFDFERGMRTKEFGLRARESEATIAARTAEQETARAQLGMERERHEALYGTPGEPGPWAGDYGRPGKKGIEQERLDIARRDLDLRERQMQQSLGITMGEFGKFSEQATTEVTQELALLDDDSKASLEDRYGYPPGSFDVHRMEITQRMQREKLLGLLGQAASVVGKTPEELGARIGAGGGGAPAPRPQTPEVNPAEQAVLDLEQEIQFVEPNERGVYESEIKRLLPQTSERFQAERKTLFSKAATKLREKREFHEKQKQRSALARARSVK